jgi:hypothetical protein
MQNKKHPLHCKCRIYDDRTQKAGNICIYCGSRIKAGLPSMRELEHRVNEDKAIDRIMAT